MRMTRDPQILPNTATRHSKQSRDGREARPEESASDPEARDQSPAPGAPGEDPKWTCASKSGVGCALSPASHLWFTLGRGIVNEVYYPWIDRAAVRQIGLIVTDGRDYFCDEEHDTLQEVSLFAPGVPAYRLVNACKSGRCRIEKDVLVDPERDVLLQRVSLVPLQGSIEDYRLYVLLSPRLGDCGRGNSAWVGQYNGRPMLLAKDDQHALALACSTNWRQRTVGFVGRSDPLLDLRRNKRITQVYTRADSGNVMLAGEIDLPACGGQFVLATAFDRSAAAASLTAVLSLQDTFEQARDRLADEWSAWHDPLAPPGDDDSESEKQPTRDQAAASAAAPGWAQPDRSRPFVAPDAKATPPDLYRTSTMVLRVHRSLHFAGAGVASLTVPWGEARGDSDLGGYHLVWARDLVEEAGGLLAAGAHEDARRVIRYLRATQKPDGHWPQDMWLDGTAYMEGVQMDEAALPILLIDLARRVSAIGAGQVHALWPMVRSAAGFVARRGPATRQDRWENAPGYTPFTLACEIAALLAAADLAEWHGQPDLARQWRDTADAWNDSIERWTYVTGTDLARRAGVEGYYVRTAPPDRPASQARGMLEASAHRLPVAEVVSPDALALVRFGVRAADDLRILNTVKAIDLATRVQTPFGPCWRRYNGDYYGEHDDGTPPQGHGDNQGHGRAWPLLTGERGHYELAAGDPAEARQMLASMEGFASAVGLLPEQVWDAEAIPQKGLHPGRPSGSAMPLAWAHAEYVRLVRSIRDGRVFDMPPQPYERYVRGKRT